MNVKELATKIYVSMFGNIAMDATPEVLTVIEALLTEYSRDIEFNVAKAMESLERKAVAKEREECAKVCEDWNCGSNVTKKVNLTLVAAQIRRRGEK